ncbi:MAG TPA: serine hydrolase domain-containing protein [Verrucomicrobiae bacterium]|nr:serine hydrolase domain-containing protein [Verrucomicrobiae bacterium]
MSARLLCCLNAVLLVHFARADRVDDYVIQQMKEHRIPGLCLSVVTNGIPMKTASYGFANLELKTPVKPETVFEIGSLTKQFTAACILLLVDEGKLSLDDPISHFLEGAPGSWSRITVRHLLTHTSGIKSYTGLDGFELRRHLSQAQFIHAIGALPVEFAPGDSWKYCNTGYNLLGYIIENVTHKSYWDFLSEGILEPLGMTATTNRLPALVIPNRAAGYEQTNHVWINRDSDITDVFSAGAIASSVADLIKWNAALDRDDLLSPASKRLMWTPMNLSNGQSTHYGFGWNIGSFERHLNIGHGGATSGFSASLQRFPDDKLAVIVLTNTDEAIATILARKIASLEFDIVAAKPL